MSDLKQHPEVEEDLAKVSSADTAMSMRLVRLNEFVKEIERVSRMEQYRQKWPDRLDESSIAVKESLRPVTIYMWQREGFMLCLEERWSSPSARRPGFRWLVCAPEVDAQTALAIATRRAHLSVGLT